MWLADKIAVATWVIENQGERTVVVGQLLAPFGGDYARLEPDCWRSQRAAFGQTWVTYTIDEAAFRPAR